MKKHILANIAQVLNTDTWKLEPLDCRWHNESTAITYVEVPIYLWRAMEFPDEAVECKRGGVTYRLVEELELNDCAIALNMTTTGTAPLAPVIVFSDGDIKMNMQVDNSYGAIHLNMQTESGLGGVHISVINYVYQVLDKADKYRQSLAQTFSRITNLGYVRFDKAFVNDFSFGIPSVKFDVKYKGNRLNGMWNVLLYGPVAILLDDSMKFDSLAIMSGVKDGLVTVEKFLYSTNPYIVKVITLMH